MNSLTCRLCDCALEIRLVINEDNEIFLQFYCSECGFIFKKNMSEIIEFSKLKNDNE